MRVCVYIAFSCVYYLFTVLKLTHKLHWNIESDEVVIGRKRERASEADFVEKKQAALFNYTLLDIDFSSVVGPSNNKQRARKHRWCRHASDVAVSCRAHIV